MADNAPARRETSPAKGKDAVVTGKPRRPSFASPTKASMSRSNPDLVKRKDAQRSQAGGASGRDALASNPGEGSSEGEAEEDDNEDRRAGAAAASQGSQRATSMAHSTGGMAGRPKRSPVKPAPRPFPPRPQDEDEFIDPFQGRKLRRSPPPGVLPQIQREEPDLPPTPTQAGLSDPAVVNSPPSGIHSSPSKRARRNRDLSERIKSSPLKQPPLQTAQLQEDPPSPSTAKRSRLGKEKQAKSKSEAQRKPHKARKVKDSDPLISQRAARDSLLDEITSLRRDLAMLNRESERLYRSQQARQDKTTAESFDDMESLVDVLSRRVLPPEEKAPPNPTEEWIEAALNPVALLPFGGDPSSIPLLLPSFKEEDQSEEPEEPPVSHHPVVMTAQEELPYLQLFSNLTFKSSITIIPRARNADPDDSPIMQKHSISISSTPPGFFAAKLDLTVNTKKLSITELSVPRLEPAAASELGPFVHAIVDEKNNKSNGHIRNSVLTRNASVVTWAMGEWLRLATKRARFWCAVEQTLSSKEGIAEAVAAMRAGKKRKRQQRDSDDEDSDNDGAARDKHRRLTKAQMLPHLGRTSLDLKIPIAGVSDDDEDDNDRLPSIRIQWIIGFDWTGEGQSKMGVQIETPPKWHGQDHNAKLGKIPGVFDKLIADKVEPLEAVKTVVALLVGDDWR